jgi:hypothetical protein
MMYGDGIDCMKNALGLFAGKKKVVVFILEKLYMSPTERQRMHNLHVATVAFEKGEFIAVSLLAGPID